MAPAALSVSTPLDATPSASPAPTCRICASPRPSRSRSGTAWNCWLTHSTWPITPTSPASPPQAILWERALPPAAAWLRHPVSTSTALPLVLRTAQTATSPTHPDSFSWAFGLSSKSADLNSRQLRLPRFFVLCARSLSVVNFQRNCLCFTVMPIASRPTAGYNHREIFLPLHAGLPRAERSIFRDPRLREENHCSSSSSDFHSRPAFCLG